MGYVVLHMSKAKGNDSRTTAHIERTINPKNADKSRTHLNRELIEFPDGITNRTQAIQHRIETAGIKRKITKDQVRVIRINLSGTHEDMKRIEAEGKLDEWCKDTVDWLKKTYGEKNVVSTVLHMDEKTPHIHASLVPIVVGQRRKAKEGEKKKKDTVRLCADDIMTKTKMVEYQDSYAIAMAKYGLERGIRGSEAKHITTAEYYRDIFEQTQTMQEEIDSLQMQKGEGEQAVKLLQEKEQLGIQRLTVLQQETSQKASELEEKEKQLREVKNEVLKLGFEKSAKSAGKEVLEGLGALMGNPKAKKLQAEIDILKQDIHILQEEKEDIEKQAQKSIQAKDKMILEKDSLIATQKTKLDKLFDYIPVLNEYDFIVRLCEVIKLPANIVKQVFTGKEVGYWGKLYSPEHKQDFEADNTKISIARNPKDNKLCLAIGGMYYADWFREQKNKFLENLNIRVKEPKKSQGQKW